MPTDSPAPTTTRPDPGITAKAGQAMAVTAEMPAEAAMAVVTEAGAAAEMAEAVVATGEGLRFVAFSAIDGQPWEAGADAASLLERVRSLSALGIGLTRCTEILDCGAEADEVLREGVALDAARRRFRTVFRGEDGGPGLAAVELQAEDDEGPESKRKEKP